MAEYTIFERGRGKWVQDRNGTTMFTSSESQATPFPSFFSLDRAAESLDIFDLYSQGCLEQHVPLYRMFNEDRKLGQNQYASRYCDGRIEGFPNLGEGLRWQPGTNFAAYHSIRIHRDDYAEFRRRHQRYCELCVEGKQALADSLVPEMNG